MFVTKLVFAFYISYILKTFVFCKIEEKYEIQGGLNYSEHYFSRSYYLTEMVYREDLRYDVKVIPEDKRVSTKMMDSDEKRFVFVMERPGPLTLMVTPCSSRIILRLSLRRASHFIPHEFLTSTTQAPSTEFLWNEVKLRKTIRKWMNKMKKSTNLKEKEIKKLRRKLKKKLIYQNKKTGSQRQTKEINTTDDDFYNDYLREIPDNDILAAQGENLLAKWSGEDPWIYSRSLNLDGLYVLRIKNVYSTSLHLWASRQSPTSLGEESPIFTHSPQPRLNDVVTFLWKSKSYGPFCLAMSQERSYSSLCQARERMKKALLDPSLLLGCMTGSKYTLPSLPRNQYHITVWNKQDSTVVGNSTIRVQKVTRFPVLRPRKLLSIKLVAGGEATVKFKSRHVGKKVHIAVVSCTGGVRVLVTTTKGHRVAQAKGKEAFHLVVNRPPSLPLLISVSHSPNSAASYKILLAATHSARLLPVPRLPRQIGIEVQVLSCTSASIFWSKARGEAMYCVLLKWNPTARNRILSPPLQCGWEEVIRNPSSLYDYAWCGSVIGFSRLQKVASPLRSAASYIAVVLVQHPNTNRTLSLMPALFETPSCFEL